MAAGGRQSRPISLPELRSCDLPPQDLEFVAQHQQFDVFHAQTTTATNERTQHGPNSKVEKGEDHAADPPSRGATEKRHAFWRPSG